MGNQDAARRRLSLVESVSVLSIGDGVILLSEQLQKFAKLPPRASADALHIALAAFHRMEFLLTWNCRHIANGRTRRTIGETLTAQGMTSPIIVTPEELPEED